MKDIIEITALFVNSTGFWTIVGILVTALCGHLLSKDRDRTTRLLTSYAELHGIKKVLKQYYVSRFEAFAYSDYNEQMWRLSCKQSTLDLNEAQRWMQKAEDMGLEISHLEEKLAKICAVFLVHFRKDKERVRDIVSLITHPVPFIATRPDATWNVTQLEDWKLKIVPVLQVLVDEIFDPRFEKLLKPEFLPRYLS